MNKRGRILRDIERLLDLFETSCADVSTLHELRTLLPNKEDWPNARGVFDRIRDKTLLAERCGDQLKCCQYDFEEKIAKTIYNLSIPRTPFDPDSPYWIIPSALALAERCKLPVESVLSIAHA